ncbi:MAG: Na/Pi symporter [Dysosmobacter sp.]
MDIFSVFTLCGGLAFFLYGMNTMSKSLEKMAGGKLERLLKRMTSNPVKSLLLGAGITIAIQSSSAMTVMLVGLVNSGVMELGQTIGVIMGSNIGTTLTAWILSLTGIQSESIFVNMLKPENFSPLVALAGIILIMGSKRQKRRDIGRILVGFSILMYGMELMKDAVSPSAVCRHSPSLLTAFQNPLLGVLVGAVFTGDDPVFRRLRGYLQALALTGSITYGMAIPIIMGQNIGTCVTALLSSIGVNRNAKRVAVIHISFNVIGTVVCHVLFYGANLIFDFSFLDWTVGAVGIAFCHTVFNVFTTLMLLPFSRQLEALARRLIRTENPAKEALPSWIPCCSAPPAWPSANVCIWPAGWEKLPGTMCCWQWSSSPASGGAGRRSWKMRTSWTPMRTGWAAIWWRVSQHGVSMADIRTVSRLLHAIGDFERIGDHAINVQDSARELQEKELHGSLPRPRRNLRSWEQPWRTSSFRPSPVSTRMIRRPPRRWSLWRRPSTSSPRRSGMRHIQRLQTGECTIQLGFVLNDLLTNLERVSDHCSNIAVCVIEEGDSSVDHHAYLHRLKVDDNFAEELREDLSKYRLPNA